MNITKLLNGQFQIINTVTITPQNGVPYTTSSSEIVTKDQLISMQTVLQAELSDVVAKLSAINSLPISQ